MYMHSYNITIITIVIIIIIIIIIIVVIIIIIIITVLIDGYYTVGVIYLIVYKRHWGCGQSLFRS